MSIVQVSQIGDNVTVLEVQGRVNLGNYQELEKAAQEAYDKGVRNIIIDLTGADSLTSIGIRSLVSIYKIFDANQEGKCKLAGVREEIKDMFNIAGITQFIEMYDTAEAAAGSF